MTPATSAKLLLSLGALFCVLQMLECGVVDRQPRAYRQYNSEPQKRPFCNAFTGCGKKRSTATSPPSTASSAAAAALLQRHLQNMESTRKDRSGGDFDPNEESISSLLDLNTEPAVEDLLRQIMSEAKLWEAIQEANREIYLQKSGINQHRGDFPLTFSTQ
ncbi:cardioactive peptide [Anopheles aquasalis]|uniref:cardioactive peptide n=1 Tax=Anopheles aquasalis TaxID=42839 RepID=UPI00215AF183|nr:cardioactive peptide [Anopheles aquasalis]